MGRPLLVRCPRRSIAVAATTATIAAATTTAAAIAAATTATRLAGLGFVDRQPASVVFLLMQAGNGRLGLGIGIHLDESESLGPVRFAINNYLCALHSSELREQRLQVGLTHTVGQIAYIQLLGQDQSSPTEVDDPQDAFRVEKKGVSVEARWVGKASREAVTESDRASIATRSSNLPIPRVTEHKANEQILLIRHEAVLTANRRAEKAPGRNGVRPHRPRRPDDAKAMWVSAGAK